jgi:ComF family protein
LSRFARFGTGTYRELQLLFRAALWALVDFVYPNFCLVCSRSLCEPSERICRSCLDAIPRRSPVLGYLANEQSPEDRLPYLAIWEYQEPLPAIIHALKYGGTWKVASQLGHEIAAQIINHEEFASADLLVPVPLHRLRRRERGYNQSQKLAEEISKFTRQPVAMALHRVRNTRTQTALSATERRRNVRGAFRVRSGAAVLGRRVLLVDDVLTTGATAQECARTLGQAGASEVMLVVAARA